jgi:hypothetical protein
VSALRERFLARPERALALLLALVAVASALDLGRRPACIDYYQFWVVGRAVAARETSDVYSDAERTRLGDLYGQRAFAEAQASASEVPASAGRPAVAATKRLQAARQRPTLETYSTPWLYTLFGLFSSADYDASQGAFQLASLAAYLLAIALFARLLALPLAAALLWTAALLQASGPFVDDVIAGNVNRLQLLALAAVLFLGARGRFRGRHAVAGALLGATLAFKPNLAPAALALLLGWTIAGERRRALATLAGIAGGGAAAVLASAAFFGSLEPWRAWLRELPVLMSPGSPSAGSADEGNLSLARLLHDTAGVSLGSLLAVLLFAALAAALVLGRRRRAPAEPAAPDAARDLLFLGSGAAIGLLASELAWLHYFVVLVPLAMALLRPARPGLALAALAGLAMVSLQGVERALGAHRPALAAAVVAGGTLLLFGAALADLARRPEPA